MKDLDAEYRNKSANFFAVCPYSAGFVILKNFNPPLAAEYLSVGNFLNSFLAFQLLI